MSALAACGNDRDSDLALTQNGLTGAAGGRAICVPVDTKDTVPDHIDEDCDGRIDEDVDATRANCPFGMRIIEGTRGDDVIHGTSGRDCILGYGGNDTIYGEAGDDLIFGGPGDDHIFTGKGNAIVHAGAGADTVDTTGGFASTVFGEAGADTLKGGSGPDIFYGGDDNDVLIGGGGPDVLNGGGCHDLIIGGAGLDLDIGGKDFDACEGELISECEKTGATRVLCHVDTDCHTDERCAGNSGFCVPRTAALCPTSSCNKTSNTDDSCNGIDDDCDGVIDDDYVAHSTPCGAGACSAMGTTSCVNGAVVDSCRAGSALPGNDSTCDRVDDDCDGHVDEGFVGAATSCGVGVCGSTGVISCVNGAVVDSCAAGAPGATTDTTCDGVDDDCDGAIDEDFASGVSTCGVGVCQRNGASRCVAGVLSDTCVPGTPNAETDESCNGLDDDCNGAIDDAYLGVDTSCGFGMCQRSGHTSCDGGRVVDSCQVTCEGQCNDGAEDDNDGLIDCADPDCANAMGCLDRSFGSPCAEDSQCDRASVQATCVRGFPGGYCSKLCSSNAGCPDGTFCLNNTACVVGCGPGDHCGRVGYACSAVQGLGSSPWCHPTCALSCPTGLTCNPLTSQCQ